VNPNEYYKDDPEKKWKILCYRFIGRSRRLESLKELKCPTVIIDKEKAMIQEAYEQMREACLTDKDYLSTWEDKNIS
jgi:hypothetical protein